MKRIPHTTTPAGFFERALRWALVCTLFLGIADQGHAQTLPNNIDISVSTNGIVPLPVTLDPVFRNVFERYTKIVAPNGQAIHILIENQVTDEMAVRSREVMRFYLTNAPGTQYGANKTAVANSMGNLNATLVYFNTQASAEQALAGPLGNANIFGQDLYASESVVEGTAAYINNTNRDATLEEVFHLVHGAGLQPALPAFHAELTAAKDAAKAAGHWTPPPDLPPQDEVFEYIISVIDVYYGYWAHNPSGNGTSFGGEYAFHTRASVQAGDPAGVNSMRKFLPEFFSADLRSAASFNGSFTLTFDPGTPYTHKSQYLTGLSLSGSSDSNLTGNGLGNLLAGNSGNNAISGGSGSDTASFAGARAEHVIQCDASGLTVDDMAANRDGRDSLSSIEFLRFSDQTVGVDAVCSQSNPPTAPTSLTATPQSATEVLLMWRDNSADESAFEIERRTATGAFQAVANVSVDITQHRDSGLQPGTEYSYRVRASNSTGNSGYSNTASAMPIAPGPCTASDTSTCLNSGRFQVEVTWRDFSDGTGTGKVVPFGSDDSGLFWFFDSDNWELLIKVLDGCTFNDRYWVFAAAVTNVEYTLTVTDTLSGAVKNYHNPLGVASPATTDTGAFATCP